VPVHVLLNNNNSNYAVVNAFDFGALLGLRLPRPPGPVIETLRQRDGAIPDWVETSAPIASPPPEQGGMYGGVHDGYGVLSTQRPWTPACGQWGGHAQRQRDT
jgi:hypothetical protein